MTNKCEECGKDFEARMRSQKSCSVACRKARSARKSKEFRLRKGKK